MIHILNNTRHKSLRTTLALNPEMVRRVLLFQQLQFYLYKVLRLLRGLAQYSHLNLTEIIGQQHLAGFGGAPLQSMKS